MSFWTDERVALLKQLWTARKSAGAIAAVLGCTRNAVIGKSHRLELPGRASPIRRTPNRSKRIHALLFTPPAEQEQTGCEYIAWDGQVCGQPIHKSCLCQKHYGDCWREPPPRTRKPNTMDTFERKRRASSRFYMG